MAAVAERPTFRDQLIPHWKAGRFVSAGLDSDHAGLPEHLKLETPNSLAAVVFKFNKAIIDKTADLVLGYKPNAAFYEAYGPEGWLALKETVDYIHDEYPTLPVTLDAKRADIGKTMDKYLVMAFGYVGADAVTTNAQYFGSDALKPFDAFPGRGAILMAKTSNDSSGELQDMPIDLDGALKRKLVTLDEFAEMRSLLQGNNPDVCQLVGYFAAHRWDKRGDLGVVVGATYPESFLDMRKLTGDLFYLVPGIGDQEGDLLGVLRNAPDSRGHGMIINSSSGIAGASKGRDFDVAARAAALKLHTEITDTRAKIYGGH